MSATNVQHERPDDPAEEKDGATSSASAASAEAKRILSDAKGTVTPVETVPPSPKAEELTFDDGGSSRFLTAFMSRSIFLDYFCLVADRNYAGKNMGLKVRKLRDGSPRFYKFCVAADVFVKSATGLVLLAGSTAVLYKALMPLPLP